MRMCFFKDRSVACKENDQFLLLSFYSKRKDRCKIKVLIRCRKKKDFVVCSSGIEILCRGRSVHFLRSSSVLYEICGERCS